MFLFFKASSGESLFYVPYLSRPVPYLRPVLYSLSLFGPSLTVFFSTGLNKPVQRSLFIVKFKSGDLSRP